MDRFKCRAILNDEQLDPITTYADDMNEAEYSAVDTLGTVLDHELYKLRKGKSSVIDLWCTHEGAP